MRVAIVHEWLVTRAGSERVVEQLLQVWPQADLFALIDFYSEADRAHIGGRHARTTFLQNFPGARTRYRSLLPLMPLAVEQLDLSSYDLVISSSHAVAKGVLTGPDQVHVSYVHSPIRYAWDLQHQYLRESGLLGGPKAWLARWLLHRIRIWDYRTAAGVDQFVANSEFIARRIRKVYGRDSVVVHPPVEIDAFPLQEQKQDYYLCASRMVPYKQMPLIVEAFAGMPGRRLVVIGEGPELQRVRALAAPNIEVLGYQPHAELRRHMQAAKAFVFAAEEDFGIMPVEVQACGTPVIAYGRGGARDTVLPPESSSHPTGMFFEAQTVDAIRAAVDRFEALAPRFSPQACREHALQFDEAVFRRRIAEVVDEACRRHPRFSRQTATAQE
ncbi:glycosyltransferase involved in cell wall biosynthesis [Rivibacter subsaxonicus]|uniref:Glycosyltransferase involved in cell wall biosynthesis n=1 Tax=Rivibacter subsaxonicus TaxID=457575 RepID=A0A4Q7W079_9BURK|nr:glycosyltransferase involved in cell wall biosynthesis [Rivibacter subsaxonicus]